MRWPSYDNMFFLLESVERYFMMLALMRDNRSKFIVPTYDIGRRNPRARVAPAPICDRRSHLRSQITSPIEDHIS